MDLQPVQLQQLILRQFCQQFYDIFHGCMEVAMQEEDDVDTVSQVTPAFGRRWILRLFDGLTSSSEEAYGFL